MVGGFYKTFFMKYKLSYDSWGTEEKKAIKQIISSGNYSLGSEVQKFEKKFAKYIGMKYAIMTNSGSSANLLGINSYFFKKKNKLKAGDEVLVPALAWSTTYSPLFQNNLKIKIIDVSLENLNINIDLLEKAITPKTKVICAVNILGIPCNLKKIRKLCNTKNIILYEDNCESLGASISGKKTGSFGDFSTHSFFFSHHISTIEGGMVLTNNYETYEIIKSLRAHGWTRDIPNNNSIYKIKKKDFDSEYKFILPGYNLRPSEINASIGIEQLKKLNKMIKIRRENLKIFESFFRNDDRFIIPKTDYISSSFSFPLIMRDNTKGQREKLFKRLKSENIEYRLVAGGNFLSQPQKKYYDYEIFSKIKNAERIHNDGFCVGNSSKDLSKEIKFLYNVIS